MQNANVERKMERTITISIQDDVRAYMAEHIPTGEFHSSLGYLNDWGFAGYNRVRISAHVSTGSFELEAIYLDADDRYFFLVATWDDVKKRFSFHS